MSPEEQDDERFFAELAGRTPEQAEPSRGAAALRNALQTQIETIRAAEQNAVDDLSSDERARMEEVKRQLLAAGVFKGASTREHRGLNWLRTVWLGSAWPQWLTVAASIVIVTGVVFELMLPTPPIPEIERGAAEPVLWTSNAAATAQQLAADLNRAGAEAVAIQIHRTEWSVRIDKIENRAAVSKTLAHAGVERTGDRIDRVIVRERR